MIDYFSPFESTNYGQERNKDVCHYQEVSDTCRLVKQICIILAKAFSCYISTSLSLVNFLCASYLWLRPALTYKLVEESKTLKTAETDPGSKLQGLVQSFVLIISASFSNCHLNHFNTLSQAAGRLWCLLVWWFHRCLHLIIEFLYKFFYQY